MSNVTASIQVCVDERAVWIKISGRANFTASVDFKKVVNELRRRGSRRFVLDLTECLLMDSTFLGVLARIALDLAEAEKTGGNRPIELLNPNERVADMLDNLGVLTLFTVSRHPANGGHKFEAVESVADSTPKAEISRNCLEAHQTLMEVNPDNVPRFKDVARFLEENLKKDQGKGQV